MLLLFQADFLFESALQLVGSPLELGQALAERSSEFRQLSGPKNDQSDHENDDQLGHANRTKHSDPTFRKPSGTTLTTIIGIGLPNGQENPPRKSPEVVACKEVICYDAESCDASVPSPPLCSCSLLSALVGGIFGRNALATDDRVLEYYKTFTAALSAIESSYVDKVDSDRLVYGAIRGMLGTLDPHSSFFDPKEYAEMRERQEGRYYGLGITIQSINGDITARSVFEGSPAFKKGIRRGDVIAKIGERGRQGLDHRAGDEEAARRRRARSSRSRLKRRGYAEPIPLEVTRDEVQILTVPAYFMIDATTGYIRHQDWGENTDREIQHALHELKAKGMKRLLYDIRANPGGPLDQAIKVSGRVPAARRHGRLHAGPRAELRARTIARPRTATFTDVPMVIIANRNSASASEIFTGALQDHDRAYIVGETTFGKALVQSVYPISGGAALALDDRALLHAARPPDSAPVGRDLRRVSELHAARSGRQQAAQPERPEAHRRRSSGLQRRRHRARQVPRRTDRRRAGIRFHGDAVRPHAVTRVGSSRTTRRSSTPAGDKRIAQTSTGRVTVVAELRRGRCDDRGLPRVPEGDNRIKIDEAAFAKDSEFIRAMIRYRIDEALFGRAEALRRLDPGRSAGAAGPRIVWRSREAAGHCRRRRRRAH